MDWRCFKSKTTKVPKPLLPFKTRIQIAAYTFAVDTCRRSNYTINRRLISFFDPKVPAPSTKLVNGVSVSSSDVTVDASTDRWFRLFVPTITTTSDSDPQQKLPLIFFIHGGGFSFFSPSTKPYDDFCRSLAGRLSAVVVSVNYRLSPEHRFPCQYDDVYAVLKFIDSQNHAVLPSNADLSKCFIAGDSAGGNIGHHVTLRACQNIQQDLKALNILGLVLIQPFFGGEERTESELKLTKVPLVNVERTDWSWKAFLPEGSDRNHEAVNVFGSASDSVPEEVWRDKFPATIVFVGGFDPLQDWQRRYYQDLKERKKCDGKEEQVKLIEYPNAIHAFYGFPDFPEASFLIRDLKDFIEKHLSSSM